MGEPKAEHLRVLKKYFGHSQFRPMQWQIIKSLLVDKRDNCVVMATGYGKSLCYQFPPVFCNGTAIVVSPLISLMQDQVLSLQVCSIEACFLGSAQSSKSKTENEILTGKYRLVYVTPEWCSSEGGKKFILLMQKTIKVSLVAIDEAHCVSQWGMDFRKSYRNLGVLRLALPEVPFLTVTATATPQVVADICSSLRLRKPAIVKTSFDRPNLYLSVSLKSDNMVKDIQSVLFEHGFKSDGTSVSTIIYCPTKKTADRIYSVLSESGMRCEMYHADLSMSVRTRVHKDFVTDKVPIVVATVAFGMGIDKPDVRVIIHYGAPREIESYYQEIGRAGRDGQPAYCHVVYSSSDFNTNKYFFSSLCGKFKEHKEDMANLMENYLETSRCRRKILLGHFDPDFTLEPYSECCDNCTSIKRGKVKIDGKFDLTEDALLLLEAVSALGGKFGLLVPIFLVRGSCNQRLPRNYYTHPIYSKGHGKSEAYWKSLGRVLLKAGLLVEEPSKFGHGWNRNNFPISCINTTSKGNRFLKNRGDDSILLEPTADMISDAKFLESLTEDNWMKSHSQNSQEIAAAPVKTLKDKIYDRLMALRSDIADDLDCMPYMVCSNKVLHELADKKPNSPSLLENYDGFTKAKISKFGEKIIYCIMNSSEEDHTIHENTQAKGKQFKKHVKQKEAPPPMCSYLVEINDSIEEENMKPSEELYERRDVSPEKLPQVPGVSAEKLPRASSVSPQKSPEGSCVDSEPDTSQRIPQADDCKEDDTGSVDSFKTCCTSEHPSAAKKANLDTADVGNEHLWEECDDAESIFSSIDLEKLDSEGVFLQDSPGTPGQNPTDIQPQQLDVTLTSGYPDSTSFERTLVETNQKDKTFNSSYPNYSLSSVGCSRASKRAFRDFDESDSDSDSCPGVNSSKKVKDSSLGKNIKDESSLGKNIKGSSLGKKVPSKIVRSKKIII